MRLVSAATGMMVGGAVIALSGCFSPAPYGAYGPQPGFYQQPIQTLQPGAPYVPGSTYPPGSTPSTIYSSPMGSGGLVPLDGGNAPPYSGSTGSTTPQVRPVPNPSDPYYSNPGSNPAGQTFQQPVTPQQQYNPSPTGPSSNPFATPPAGTQEISHPGARPLPLLEVRGGPQFAPTMTVAYHVEDPFEDASVSATEHHVARPADQVASVAPEADTSSGGLFDHDRDGYRWLRGIVSYDPVDRTWSIIYDDAPDQDDRFAGHLTLVNHPELSRLTDGCEVVVHGLVEPVLTDRFGRPVYLVTRIETHEG